MTWDDEVETGATEQVTSKARAATKQCAYGHRLHTALESIMSGTNARGRTTMAKTSDKTSARNRARQALAAKQRERRERDERMEAAATRYFTAADAIEKAQLDAGAAIKALVDEGEPRTEIADLLGITTRDIKQTLNALDDQGQTEQSHTSGGDREGGVVSEPTTNADTSSTERRDVA